MKFYLVYRNHGLYDPVLDDSESIYITIGPNNIDQGALPQKCEEIQNKPHAPVTKDYLNEDVLLNLNYKDVFPEINIEELPANIKFKLPISEHYDPDGKKINLQNLYNRNIFVSVNQISNLLEESKKSVDGEYLFLNIKEDNSECTKRDLNKEEDSCLIITKERTEREGIGKRTSIVDHTLKVPTTESHLKLNDKLFELNESCKFRKNEILSESPQKNIDKEMKSFPNINTEKIKFELETYKVDNEEKLSEKEIKRDINVAEEIKKFEFFNIEANSKLNAQQRKLLTLQDVEEAIEAGTVRERTERFKKGTEEVNFEKCTKSSISEVKTSAIEIAKQKAFNIGLKVIPHLLATVKSFSYSSLILKNFLVKLTQIMITLHKYIPEESKFFFYQSEEKLDANAENNESNVDMFKDYSHKINFNNDETRRNSMCEIKKGKLSGAKLAQIEGLKPAELTDKMNIVISEFLRKSGREEMSDETIFKDRRNRSEEGNESDEFLKSSTFRHETNTDRKFKEETFETKTQSLEIREMKSEKRYSEYKTSKRDKQTYEEDCKVRDDGNLTYIAIVEAHVYTNKNAIFEEQMRQFSENITELGMMESGVTYYKCEVSVFYRNFKEPLQPTVVIESIEEIPSEEVLEHKNSDVLQKGSSGVEEIAKKLAVQKITEVIEPLLKFKEIKSVNIKQAYPSIEMPLKSVAESATITMDKEANILERSTLTKDIQIAFEEPVKPVVEISEMCIEENKSKFDLPEVVKFNTMPVIDVSAKTIAEKTEVLIEEQSNGVLDIFPQISRKPNEIFLEEPVLILAESKKVFIEEPFDQEIRVSKVSKHEAKMEIDTNIAMEITEVAVNENTQKSLDMEVDNQQAHITIQELKATEISNIYAEEREQKDLRALDFTQKIPYSSIENKYLAAAETFVITPEETEKVFEMNKNLNQTAHFDVLEMKAAIVSSVHLEEPKQETLDVPKIVDFRPQTNMEFCTLNVAESVTISLEEPQYDDLEIPNINSREIHTVVDGFGLNVAESLLVSPEETEQLFKINENMYQQAHVDLTKMRAATVSSIHLEEPNEEILNIHNRVDILPKTAIEHSTLSVAENVTITTEEPFYDCLEISNIVSKQILSSIEGSGLNTAEVLNTIPYHSEIVDYNGTKKINEQANIKISESKVATTSLVFVEETNEVNLNLPLIDKKQPHVTLHDTLATAVTYEILPEESYVRQNEISKSEQNRVNIEFDEFKSAFTTVIVVEEPRHENLVVSKVEERKIQPLIENRMLSIAETNTISLVELQCNNFLVDTITFDRVNIILDGIKPIIINVITAYEDISKDRELGQIFKKEPTISIEERFLPTAETTVVQIAESETEINASAKKDIQAMVRAEVFETAETVEVTVMEPKEEKLVLKDFCEVKHRQPYTLLEEDFLTVAQTTAVLPVESKIDIDATTKHVEQASVNLRLFESVNTTEITTGEPREENLIIRETNLIDHKIALVESHLAAAEILLTVSEEPRGTLDEVKMRSDIAHIEMIEQKVPETIFVLPLESKCEDLISVDVVKKIPHTLIESSSLPVAENSLIFCDEQVDQVVKTENNLAKQPIINLEGLNVPEIIATKIEESFHEVKQSDIHEVAKKETQPVTVETYLGVAETLSNLPLEPKEKLFQISETVVQYAQLEILELRYIQTTEIYVGDFQGDEIIAFKINVKESECFVDKSFKTVAVVNVVYVNESEDVVVVPPEALSKNASITFEMNTATTAIMVILLEHLLQYEDVQILYKQANISTVELLASAVAKSTFVNVAEYVSNIGSSSSSTISSVSSTPVIEEYVFGIQGHEYRVQSPQDTSLDIRKESKNALYQVQDMDTSYTLAVEALYEDEDDIYIEEKFSDVDVNKKQFWISDIKTVESLESSDAKTQLMKVNKIINKQAGKDYILAKYQLDDNQNVSSVIDLTKNEQSFIPSADFEINLNTLDKCQIYETQGSDIQQNAVFEFRTGKAFQSSNIMQSTDASVNVKSNTIKSKTVQDVDVSFGLTLECELLEDEQTLNCKKSNESKQVQSVKRKVKKGESEMFLGASKAELSTFDYESGMEAKQYLGMKTSTELNNMNSSLMIHKNVEMDNIARQDLTTKLKAKQIESDNITQANFIDIEGSSKMEENFMLHSTSEIYSTAMEKKLEAKGVSMESFSVIQQNLDSSLSSKGSLSAIKSKQASSKISKEYSSIENDLSNITSKSNLSMTQNLSEGVYSATEGDVILSTMSDTNSISAIQSDIKSNTSSIIESSKFSETSTQELSLQMQLKNRSCEAVSSGIKSPTSVPSTPSEYIFRLQTLFPGETIFVPRDCSFTPESLSEQSLIIVNGLVPHIDSKIERILYSPPLETPPTSPVRKSESFFTKPGLKGGTEVQELTEEDIIEIEMKSALLASAIDKTIRSIEEYKESVGMTTNAEETCTQYNLGDNKPTVISEDDEVAIKAVDEERVSITEANSTLKVVKPSSSNIVTSPFEETQSQNDRRNTKNATDDTKTRKKLQHLTRFTHM